MGSKGGLILHSPQAFNPIAEIEEAYAVTLTKINEIEDVQGTRAAQALLRVKVEIYGIEPLI